MAIKIPLEPLASSNLSASGYDSHKQILAVQFKGGAIYHYAGVPLDVAVDFHEAPSKGRYYGTTIRGKFQGHKMTGPCGSCGAHGWVGDTCDDCGTNVFLEEPFKEKSSDDREAAGSTEPGG